MYDFRTVLLQLGPYSPKNITGIGGEISKWMKAIWRRVFGMGIGYVKDSFRLYAAYFEERISNGLRGFGRRFFGMDGGHVRERSKNGWSVWRRVSEAEESDLKMNAWSAWTLCNSWCGIDIADRLPQQRMNHLKNVKKGPKSGAVICLHQSLIKSSPASFLTSPLDDCAVLSLQIFH